MIKKILIIILLLNLKLVSQVFNDEIITKEGEKYKVEIIKISGQEIEFEVLNSKGKQFIVKTYFDSLQEVNSFRNGLKINVWKYKKPKIIAKKKIETKIFEEVEKIDTALIAQLESDSINVGNLRTPTELIERYYRIDNKPVILKEIDPIYPLNVFDKNFRDTLNLKLWIDRFGELKIIEVTHFTNDEMIQPVYEVINKWLFSSATVENNQVGVWAEIDFLLQSEKPAEYFVELKIEESKPADDNIITKIESDSINIGDLSKPLENQNLQIDKKPTILKSISPNYPRLLYDKRIDCTAKVKVWISKEGEAEKIEVIESSNELLINPIKNSLINWKFNPAQFKKKNLGVWAEIFFELRFE